MSIDALSDRDLLDEISDKLTDLMEYNSDIGPLLREAMDRRGLRLRLRYRPAKYADGRIVTKGVKRA